MSIPGTVAKHAIISDECRMNRSNDGAILEAVSQVMHELEELFRGWPIGSGAKFHVVVSVERPEMQTEKQLEAMTH